MIISMVKGREIRNYNFLFLIPRHSKRWKYDYATRMMLQSFWRDKTHFHFS